LRSTQILERKLFYQVNVVWVMLTRTTFFILSPLNSMGVKGAGEAGAIPVGPLFAQALEDALHDVDFEILEIPLISNRLWKITSKVGG
jgi:hypothetical protein